LLSCVKIASLDWSRNKFSAINRYIMGISSMQGKQ
jgi:hypothetical protein